MSIFLPGDRVLDILSGQGGTVEGTDADMVIVPSLARARVRMDDGRQERLYFTRLKFLKDQLPDGPAERAWEPDVTEVTESDPKPLDPPKAKRRTPKASKSVSVDSDGLEGHSEDSGASS